MAARPGPWLRDGGRSAGRSVAVDPHEGHREATVQPGLQVAGDGPWIGSSRRWRDAGHSLPKGRGPSVHGRSLPIAPRARRRARSVRACRRGRSSGRSPAPRRSPRPPRTTTRHRSEVFEERPTDLPGGRWPRRRSIRAAAGPRAQVVDGGHEDVVRQARIGRGSGSVADHAGHPARVRYSAACPSLSTRFPTVTTTSP